MLLFGEAGPPLVRRGVIADISHGGIGLHLFQPLEVGVEVELEIRFPAIGGGIKTETVRGTTIYSKYIEDTYYVGIEFDKELSPKDQPDLYSRIQDILMSF